MRVFYPRIEVEGLENLPDGPSVIVSNHCQMNGPIACELYFPGNSYTWCAGEMMHLKEVPEYAYQDFWSQKPEYTRWFYRLLSYIIAPLSVLIFNNADTIGVYRDMRIISTFKRSVEKLRGGANIVIFPEHDVKHNHILYGFQDKFVDTARYYCRETGEELSFVPMYIAPKLKKMYIGKPIRFSSSAPIKEERKRICSYLMDEITSIASALPLHTVVPYRNVGRRNYPSNVPGRKAPRIKPPVVDYREFRLSRINEPRFSHLKLLLGWVGYFILYFLTENLIPAEKCYPVHCSLDDAIPFREEFLIPYVFWYFLIVGSLLYFALYNVDNFRKLSTYIIITQIAAMAIYILLPTRQDLRPAEFPRDNFLTDCVAFLYAFDTNTGVCPSLHVAYSLGIASVWCRDKDAHVLWKVFIVTAVVIICLSTAFVKQHSVVDAIAALPVCLLAECIVFKNEIFGRRMEKRMNRV